MATSGPPIQRPINRGTEPAVAELSEAECLDHLRSADVGRVAVQLPAGGVDIIPVNFVIHEDDVLFRTDGGSKLDSLRREPRVAFEADHFDYYEHRAWSVVVKGYAELVEDHDELFGLLNVEMDTWHPERKPFFVRITPQHSTGRGFTIRR